MKKPILITGIAGSGKTFKAIELTRGCNHSAFLAYNRINDYDLLRLICMMDVIVIEEVLKQKQLSTLWNWILDNCNISKKHPQFVFTSQNKIDFPDGVEGEIVRL